MNIHHFPPFWQHGQNVSRCDKLVNITLFGMCLQKMVLRSVSCQPDDQKWQICLRTVDFFRIDTWKSILQGKNEHIQNVYSIGFWFCLMWDFCASSWDCEIVLKTVSLTLKPWDLRGLQGMSFLFNVWFSVRLPLQPFNRQMFWEKFYHCSYVVLKCWQLPYYNSWGPLTISKCLSQLNSSCVAMSLILLLPFFS